MSKEWPIGLARAWHPVAYLADVGRRPLAVKLMGHPLVIFREGDTVGVLEDRCPHRNVPLSKGRCVGGQIECPYHGWRFDTDGNCRLVPGSREVADAPARSFPVRLDAGLVWTCIAENAADFPILPPEVLDSDYDSFWWPIGGSTGSVADALENLLDPMHSYFVHPGLVRQSRQPQAMRIRFTVTEAGCEARFTENREGLTLLQRLTEGNRTHSYARFWAPTIVQVAFDDVHGTNLATTVVFSPIDHDLTRPFTRFSTRKGKTPSWLKRAFLVGFHHPLVAQDRVMLRMQQRNADHFGGPQYRRGPIDWFGPIIWDSLNGRTLRPREENFELVG